MKNLLTVQVVPVLNQAPSYEHIRCSEVSIHAFLTSPLDGVEWSASRTNSFTPRKRDPCTHWIGGWVGPRHGLDAEKRKTPTSAGNLTAVVKSVA